MADYELIAGRKHDKRDVLSNRPVLFFFSLFVAILVWGVISMYETSETNRLFQDVKVQMALTDTVPGDLNMSVFGPSEFYCDVTVSGNSYLVNDTSFTSDKITVKPKLNEVHTPGIHEVELEATIVNGSGEISIVSVEPQFISVYFDTTVEKEMNVTLIGADEYTVAENCKIESMTLRPSSVVVSGPSLEMNNIREVRGTVAFTEPISKTVQQPVAIELVTDGKTINYSIVKEAESLYLDVQVSALRTFKMVVDFVDVPESFDVESLITYTFVDYNDILTLYVPTESEALMTSDSITVGRIDMSDFALTQWQTLPVERYNRSIFYDVLPDKMDVSFTMQTETLTAVTVNIPLLYEGENPAYTFAETVDNVTLIVPAEVAEAFSADGIYAVPNEQALGRAKVGERNVPVQIVLPENSQVIWVSGSYSVAVTVSE